MKDLYIYIYMDLQSPRAGVSSESGEATAAWWKWYGFLDEAMGASHVITPVVLISSSAPYPSSAVASPLSELTPHTRTPSDRVRREKRSRIGEELEEMWKRMERSRVEEEKKENEREIEERKRVKEKEEAYREELRDMKMGWERERAVERESWEREKAEMEKEKKAERERWEREKAEMKKETRRAGQMVKRKGAEGEGVQGKGGQTDEVVGGSII